jgi:hypothetical protein
MWNQCEKPPHELRETRTRTLYSHGWRLPSAHQGHTWLFGCLRHCKSYSWEQVTLRYGGKIWKINLFRVIKQYYFNCVYFMLSNVIEMWAWSRDMTTGRPEIQIMLWLSSGEIQKYFS